MQNLVVHSNDSACIKSGSLGMDQVIIHSLLLEPSTSSPKLANHTNLGKTVGCVI